MSQAITVNVTQGNSSAGFVVPAETVAALQFSYTADELRDKFKGFLASMIINEVRQVSMTEAAQEAEAHVATIVDAD